MFLTSDYVLIVYFLEPHLSLSSPGQFDSSRSQLCSDASTGAVRHWTHNKIAAITKSGQLWPGMFFSFFFFLIQYLKDYPTGHEVLIEGLSRTGLTNDKKKEKIEVKKKNHKIKYKYVQCKINYEELGEWKGYVPVRAESIFFPEVLELFFENV